jgi:hypothetical protein
MGIWKRFQHWITGRADSELDCEIRAHLELEAEEQHGSGTPSGQARYAARRNFGNTLSIKEDVRAAWGWGLYEGLAQDFRYALRAIRKSPGFSTVATLSLALGIGANTAIFTFVNAALLKPLPYPNADRIVALTERSPQGGDTSLVHPQSFVEWLKRARSFEDLAIAQAVPINTQGGEGAEEVPGLWVIDSETSEVIKEIPPEKILDMIAKIEKMIGLIIDEKI